MSAVPPPSNASLLRLYQDAVKDNKMTLDELQKLCDEVPRLGMSRQYMECLSDFDAKFIAAARTYMPRLIAVARTFASVASEENMRESLLCYVQGAAALEALASLERETEGGVTDELHNKILDETYGEDGG